MSNELYDQIISRRTIRKFTSQPIAPDILRSILEAARQAPSAGNKQPIKYIAVTSPEMVDEIFAVTHWAGLLKEAGPNPEEKPNCFVLVLADQAVNAGSCDNDAAAAIENMLLAAWNFGIGSCWIGAIDRQKAASAVGLADNFAIHSCVAFGYPAQISQSEDLGEAGDTAYHLAGDGTLLVPKRRFEDIVRFL